MIDVAKVDIGQQYDALAAWWDACHASSTYGVAQVTRALDCAKPGGAALDVGCGAGGRFVRLLQSRDFTITGLDASAEMIRLAQGNHPDCYFIQADIAVWDTDCKFDFILAWDCLFHLPLASQVPVLTKLCGLLASGGTLIHRFGDDVGEHSDTWREQRFHYSSIGMAQTVRVLQDLGLRVRHLELDQYPEKHAYAIAIKA